MGSVGLHVFVVVGVGDNDAVPGTTTSKRFAPARTPWHSLQVMGVCVCVCAGEISRLQLMLNSLGPAQRTAAERECHLSLIPLCVFGGGGGGEGNVPARAVLRVCPFGRQLG